MQPTEEYAPPPPPRRSRLVRVFLLVVGWLSLTTGVIGIFLPLLGALGVAFLPSSRPSLIRFAALGVSLVTFALSLGMLLGIRAVVYLLVFPGAMFFAIGEAPSAARGPARCGCARSAR